MWLFWLLLLITLLLVQIYNFNLNRSEWFIVIILYRLLLINFFLKKIWKKHLISHMERTHLSYFTWIYLANYCTYMQNICDKFKAEFHKTEMLWKVI